MEANELRLGNWVNYLGSGEVQIKDAKALFNSMEQFNYPHPKVSPIPLTEEWLIKLGFESEVSDYDVAYTLDYYYGNFKIDSADQSLYFKKNYLMDFSKIEYVHQLQNLYFALTNSELTINN